MLPFRGRPGPRRAVGSRRRTRPSPAAPAAFGAIVPARGTASRPGADGGRRPLRREGYTTGPVHPEIPVQRRGLVHPCCQGRDPPCVKGSPLPARCDLPLAERRTTALSHASVAHLATRPYCRLGDVSSAVCAYSADEISINLCARATNAIRRCSRPEASVIPSLRPCSGHSDIRRRRPKNGGEAASAVAGDSMLHVPATHSSSAMNSYNTARSRTRPACRPCFRWTLVSALSAAKQEGNPVSCRT